MEQRDFDRKPLRGFVAAWCAIALLFGMTVGCAPALAQGIADPLTEEEQALAQDGAVASARSLDDFWRWPLPGIGEDHISQTFQSGHGGLDIWCAEGTPVVASRAGTVVATEASNPMELDGYGIAVVVYHGDGTECYYAHFCARTVEVGDTVAQGQVIGYAGHTGMSFGDHLHFEIRTNAVPEQFYWGTRIDPLPYISGHDYDLGTSGFADVSDGAWYAGVVKTAADNGLMSGSNGMFRPDAKISRGEVYTILYRASGAEAAEGTEGTVVENASPFTDNDSWQFYTAAINWAARTGMASTANDTVRPNDAITREELAALMERFASSVCGVSTATDHAALAQAEDEDAIEWYFRDAVAWMAANEIMTGRVHDDGTSWIEPKENASRAEMAKIIVRTLETVGWL